MDKNLLKNSILIAMDFKQKIIIGSLKLTKNFTKIKISFNFLRLKSTTSE